MCKSREVQDRILTVNSWKLSSWGGRSAPDTENSFQVVSLMKTQGMYSTTWMLLPCVGKSEELPSSVSQITVADSR